MSIDWGMGLTNIDHETGIRFGVIGTNGVSIDALDWNCELVDAGYESWREEVLRVLAEGLKAPEKFEALVDALEPYVGSREGDLAALREVYLDVRRNHREIGEAINEMLNLYSEHYEGGGGGESRYQLVDDKYKVFQVGDTDIFVEKSPWVTRAVFCSPCAPGAGSLGSCETIGDGVDLAGDCWAYALGPEFFDEYNPMPYRVIPATNINTGDK